MGSTTVLLVIIVGAIGIIVGWQMRTSRGANADIKVFKQRIPNLRAVRNRSGLRSIVLILLTLLVLRGLMHL